MSFRLLIPFSLLLCLPAFSQSRYKFFTIGVEQGLSNPNVWGISQDKYGFIWIATVNGLNRYDGHSIKQYFNNKKDKTSLAGNTIYWIFKDSDGDMWFACGYDGLSRYNYANDNFESLPAYDSARKHNKYTAPVWRFGEDMEKRIYLSCGAACYRYNKHSGKFEDLTPLLEKNWDYGIGRFYMQDRNTMWIPTDNGLFKYDLTANKMRKIPFDAEKMGFGSAGMYDIEFINKNELLIPMERAGYVILNIHTEKFRPADEPFNPVNGRFNEMGEVLKDSKGRYWMTNTTHGLIQYFPEDGHSLFIKKEPGYPYPYEEEEGQGKTIFEDRDGNIWYGTSTQGVIRFKPDLDFILLYRRNYSTDNSLPDDNVFCFQPAGDNNIWIGTYKGICRFNRATNTYTNFSYSKIFGGLSIIPRIRSLDKNGDTLCMATNRGLILYNQRTNTFNKYDHKEGDSTGRQYTVFYDNLRTVIAVQPGELIIAGNTIARFNTAEKKCYYKENSPGDPLYNFTDVSRIIADKNKKKLWLNIASDKLYEYDLLSKKAIAHSYDKRKDSSSAIPFYAMQANSEGKLWLGISKGLIYYDPVSESSEQVTLPATSGNVINIICNKNWLWFTTVNEVGRLNIRTKKAEIFSIQALLPNAVFNARSMQADASGNLWIGSDRGYCLINQNNFIKSIISHHPQLVSFKVFNNVRHFDEPYSALKKIDLLYSENFFSFDFSSFNFENTKGIQYAYKLEGFDKDWNYTTENSASYTNVGPGHYRLLLRSSNEEGGWDESRPVTVHIKPPFWQSIWFIILCSLLVISLALLMYFSYRRQQQKKMIEDTIDYFANSVYGENSVTEICWDIARNCISQLKLQDCVVYLADTNRKVLLQQAAYGPKNPKGHEIINPIEIPFGSGIVGAVAATGKPLLINDTSKDERYIVDDAARYSELAVPIVHNGEVIGVIDSEHQRKNFFTEEHLKVITTIASISSNKIAEAKAEASAKENELQLLEINKLLAESQLMALRAQMNPHFVFNCLNSIQECIVTKKYGEASMYLNKFSKLFRLVLNNSGRVLVTLKEEIEVLELYLALEHMRFEQSFVYTVEVDEELEIDEIEIPSMLLQPYVENALWHGLMHKEGERTLNISFTKINDDIFQCRIDDNGIGRQRAAELKAQKSGTSTYQSKGMKITRDRIELLQRQNQHAALKIIDKYDTNRNATGTTVIIELSAYLQVN